MYINLFQHAERGDRAFYNLNYSKHKNPWCLKVPHCEVVWWTCVTSFGCRPTTNSKAGACNLWECRAPPLAPRLFVFFICKKPIIMLYYKVQLITKYDGLNDWHEVFWLLIVVLWIANVYVCDFNYICIFDYTVMLWIWVMMQLYTYFG